MLVKAEQILTMLFSRSETFASAKTRLHQVSICHIVKLLIALMNLGGEWIDEEERTDLSRGGA